MATRKERLALAAQEERKVNDALSRALDLLDAALSEQENAVVRILGLAERILDRNPDQNVKVAADAIVEACEFQDLTEQRIRKVRRLVRHIRDHQLVDADHLPPEGLNQHQIDALLKGERV